MIKNSMLKTGVVTTNANGENVLAIFNDSLFGTVSDLTLNGSLKPDAIATNLSLVEMKKLVNTLIFKDRTSGRLFVTSRFGTNQSLTSVVRDGIKHSFSNRMHLYFDDYAMYDEYAVEMLEYIRKSLNRELTDDMIIQDLSLNQHSNVAKLLGIVSRNQTDAFLDYFSRNVRLTFGTNLVGFALDNDIA